MVSLNCSGACFREYCELINLTESDSDYEDLQAAIEASLEEAALEKQQRYINDNDISLA